MSEPVPMYFEPWTQERESGIAYVIDCNRACVVGDVSERDALRIVSCVNALAGIEDPQKAIEMAREGLRAGARGCASPKCLGIIYDAMKALGMEDDE